MKKRRGRYLKSREETVEIYDPTLVNANQWGNTQTHIREATCIITRMTSAGKRDAGIDSVADTYTANFTPKVPELKSKMNIRRSDGTELHIVTIDPRKRIQQAICVNTKDPYGQGA